MGLFGNLLKGGASSARESLNKMAGTLDYLEGACAICALAAAAEGGIDDSEYDTSIQVIRDNKVISSAFDAGKIESTFQKMAAKTKSRSGKAELMNEIREVIDRDKTGQMGKALMYMALDVADNDEISAAETAVLKNLAAECKVNYDKLLAGTL